MGNGVLPREQTLVVRLRMRDESAFEQLLDAWTPSMVRLARSFVSTHASAEEVVQESWLAMIRGLDEFQGRSSLKTWVYRILVNTAKRRGTKESRTIPFGDLRYETDGPAIPSQRFHATEYRPTGGHWPEPEHAAEAAEIRRVIADALAELPERSRIVLALRDIEDRSAEEVCRILDISAGNQRVILCRARTAVRAHLREYFDAVGRAV